MTPQPQDEAQDRQEPAGEPLEDGDAARHLEHLGMSPDSARTFAAWHSGRYSAFRRAA
jgi:hypothetical protein